MSRLYKPTQNEKIHEKYTVPAGFHCCELYISGKIDSCHKMLMAFIQFSPGCCMAKFLYFTVQGSRCLHYIILLQLFETPYIQQQQKRFVKTCLFIFGDIIFQTKQNVLPHGRREQPRLLTSVGYGTRYAEVTTSYRQFSQKELKKRGLKPRK